LSRKTWIIASSGYIASIACSSRIVEAASTLSTSIIAVRR